MLQLQGITYRWNDTLTGINRPAGIQYGFTAQNIQQVFPTLVSKDSQGFLQTAYGTYDAMYVESIRALHQHIQTLEEDRETLQTRVDQLEAKLESMQSLEARLNQLEAALAK